MPVFKSTALWENPTLLLFVYKLSEESNFFFSCTLIKAFSVQHSESLFLNISYNRSCWSRVLWQLHFLAAENGIKVLIVPWPLLSSLTTFLIMVVNIIAGAWFFGFFPFWFLGFFTVLVLFFLKYLSLSFFQKHINAKKLASRSCSMLRYISLEFFFQKPEVQLQETRSNFYAYSVVIRPHL